MAVFALRRPIPRDPAVWAAFAVMGVLNNVIPFSLIVWGQTQIPSGLASILNATTPLSTVVVAGLLLADERFSVHKGLGVAIGFAGVVVLIGADALFVPDAPVLAQMAVLGAGLSYAFAAVFGRRFRGMGLDPLVTATGQVTFSGLIMVALAVGIDRPWTLPMPGVPVLASLLGLAVLCTAVAYGLYFRILATAGATNVILVTFLVPVTAILLGVTVLDESLRASHLVGMAVIGAGLLVMDGRVLRRTARWRAAA
jgi:drug/metabolite transporter (DMT)-like permease